jgi:hypothetical protein
VTVVDAFWAGFCVDSAVTAAARNSFATGRIPRPVHCLVDEGKHRGLECISIGT